MWHLGRTGTWLHGEAVSAGIVMAADLSHRSGWIEVDVLERTRALLLAAHLPVEPPKVRRLSLLCIDRALHCPEVLIACFACWCLICQYVFLVLIFNMRIFAISV